MSEKLDLLKDKEIKLLIKYMLPCIGGMLGLSVCILFDTVFIGRSLGDLGLAALNICLPMYNIFSAIALTFGVGGATVLAINLGKKKYHKINNIFTTSILGAIFICVCINILQCFFLDDICYLLGASNKTFQLVKEYLSVILTFNIAFILMSVLNVFVRSDGSPKLAMTGIILANITNIVLDYIFIFPLGMGMKGAALATAIGQIVGISILLIHFITGKSSMKIEFSNLNLYKFRKIILTGIPSFITEISSGFMIFVFNIVIYKVIGDIGVSAYGIITNLALIFLAVFNGVSQGVQPLISINYGADREDRVKVFLRLARTVAFSLGIIFISLGFIFPNQLIGLFTDDIGQLRDITKQGMSIYFFAFLFSGVNIINIAYLQAMEEGKKSIVLSILRGVIFVGILISILPRFLGKNGVWITVPATEIATMIVFYLLLSRNIIKSH